MLCYQLAEGVMIESIGHLWVAYSSSTGETALLNDESVAILEVLHSGAGNTQDVCASLAVDAGLKAESLVDMVNAAWPRLFEAGLVTVKPHRQVVSQ